ncbi:MAG TPA: RNA polymerase subunit sigma-70 [Candidatus Dormibacteraeota bacterium]|nr:RNA polymerase subunit sigma-70 [Candidatus Dormibacteraeota bacterium]
MLLDSAEAFGDEASGYRRELLVHCYRMLGSIDEAEDAVQDAFARAWQGRQTFRRSISLRAWLYRIATNVCLNAIEARKRHQVEPDITVSPCPVDLLTGVAATETGPEGRYDSHESISLAFLRVLQVLPPRQRAVLILRDVLTFRAAEVAALVDMSVPAVNSALQRARAVLRSTYGPQSQPAGTAGARRTNPTDLLERYVRAWESADLVGLMALLREDAVLAMPPKPMVVGARHIGDFLAGSIFAMGPMRLLEVEANGDSAFAAYLQQPADNRLVLFSLLVLTSDWCQITRIDAFTDPRVLARFELPLESAT